jgi:pyrroloquinoline quinone (PQQ) biosynthesis protein C
MSIARGQDPVAHNLVDYGALRLRRLCQGAGFGKEAEQVIATFHRLLEPWGQIPLDQASNETSGWISEIGDDHSPIEFSVAIVDGTPEVRVLLEVQGEEPTIESQCAAGVAFTERLEREFGACLTRFHEVEDLFLPEDIDPRSRFAIWHAACFSPGRAPRFKVYLNPQACGREHAQALVEEALIRLGFPHAWPLLGMTALRRGPLLDEIKYFSLDLADEPWARVKTYVHHHQATPEDLEVACSIARSYVPGEASAFACAVSGGAPCFSLRPPFTCPSFVSGAPLAPCGSDDPREPGGAAAPDSSDRPAETTLYIPVCAYAHDDAVVRQRISDALLSRGIDPALYQNVLDTFTNRPLAAGVGMQSWVAMRRQRGRLRLTVYLSTESRKVYPPGSVPAGAFEDHMFPSAESLIQALDNHGLAQHPFLQRLMRDPADTESLWLLITNAYEGTSRHFIRWLSMVTARVEDDRMRCLLARQLHQELGEGDFTRAHSVLMDGFLRSIAILQPVDFADRHLEPGRRLGGRLAHHYLADDGYEGAAALMAGEICAQQLIEVVACLIAAQPHVLAPDMLDWLSLHDELESDHADESHLLARMVPDAETALAAVRRGGMGLYQALWNFLDEMYQLCFVERGRYGAAAALGQDSMARPLLESAASERIVPVIA